MTYNYVVVCHAGAGSHSKAKEDIYKQVCIRSCDAAQAVLRCKKTTLADLIKAAVSAVKILEDDPCTNAGTGSNLSINGQVQCDASIMCGQSLKFGAIGAASNIKNPILIAEKVLQTQIDEPLLKSGRYPPSVIVGRDVSQYALDNGFNLVHENELITVERFKKLENFKNNTMSNQKSVNKRILTLDNDINVKRFKDSPEEVIEVVDVLSDTVGVIIADSLGRVVSATSSGGIFLKQGGRLGQSCMFGCGCYSEQGDDGISVTSVSTGLGEQLMRTMLLYKTCERLKSWSFDDEDCNINTQFRDFLNKEFMNSPFLNGDVSKAFGILAIRSQIFEGKISMDFLFGHSTSSLCFGYLSSKDRKAQAIMSRKKDEKQDFVVGLMGEYFTL